MSVELSLLPFKIEKGEKFLSYDDRLHQVILRTDTYGLGFVYLDDPQAKRIKYSSDKPILDAKFSHNIKYSAIKFSDFEIEIFHSETGVRSIHSCKNNKGSVIIGFYWTNNDNLLVITNTSIELYQMVDGVCKLIKDLRNLKISNFVFSAKIGILLVHLGHNQIQPFFFRSQSFDKAAKFTIECQSTLDIKNLFVTRIHEKSYCIYGDNNNIFIYELSIEAAFRIRPIKLLLSGKNSIHFVDNLIIVHSEHKISMVYDLKMIQKDRDTDNKKDEFPISAIPMSFKDPSALATTSPSGSHLNGYSDLSYQQYVMVQSQRQLYLSDWEYVHPNYIFERDTGHWYEVTLNFNTISNFLQFDSHKTIPFLQDRTLPSAKQALLSLIKSIVECKSETLESIGKIFDELNKVLFQTLNRNNTELLQKQLGISSVGTSSGGSQLNLSSGSVNSVSGTTSPSGSSLSLDQKLSRSYLYNQQNQLNQSKDKDSWKYSNPTSKDIISNSSLIMNRKNTLANSSNDDDGDTFSLMGSTEERQKKNIVGGQMGSSLSLNQGGTRNFGKPGVSGSGFIPAVRNSRTPQYILINSLDMYEKVLYPIYERMLAEQSDLSAANNNTIPKEHKERLQMDYKYLIAVIIEYIRSLSYSFCPTSDKIYDLLIQLFVDNDMFSQLHQFLQYYGIQDSDNVAYKLLSIGERYPPALQLSLDMFKRLHKPNIIISTLLERKQLLPAIRLLRSIREQDPDLYQELLSPLSVSSFLKEASTQSDILLFSVFKYFENNNLINPNNPIFEKYIKLYLEKFGTNHLTYLKKLYSSKLSSGSTSSTTSSNFDINNSRSNSPKLNSLSNNNNISSPSTPTTPTTITN